MLVHMPLHEFFAHYNDYCQGLWGADLEWYRHAELIALLHNGFFGSKKQFWKTEEFLPERLQPEPEPMDLEAIKAMFRSM